MNEKPTLKSQVKKGLSNIVNRSLKSGSGSGSSSSTNVSSDGSSAKTKKKFSLANLTGNTGRASRRASREAAKDIKEKEEEEDNVHDSSLLVQISGESISLPSSFELADQI